MYNKPAANKGFIKAATELTSATAFLLRAAISMFKRTPDHPAMAPVSVASIISKDQSCNLIRYKINPKTKLKTATKPNNRLRYFLDRQEYFSISLRCRLIDQNRIKPCPMGPNIFAPIRRTTVFAMASCPNSAGLNIRVSTLIANSPPTAMPTCPKKTQNASEGKRFLPNNRKLKCMRNK